VFADRPRAAGLFLPIALVISIAGTFTAIRTLYNNRLRYRETDFYEYYTWSWQLRLGVDPWLPQASALAPPNPFNKPVASCNYTPPFTVLFEPLTLLKPQAAYWVWQTLQMACLFGALWLLMRELRPPPQSGATMAAIGAVLLFPHSHWALYEAQPTFLLLLLIVASWRFDRHQLPFWAGLMLALAALLKLYPAAIGGYFLFRRRWRTVAWTSLLFAAGVLVFGLSYQLEFFRYGVPRFTEPWLHQGRQVGITSNLHWMLASKYGDLLPPGIETLRVILSAALSVAVVAAAVAITMKAAGEGENDGILLSIWIMTALMLSPIAWAHELPLITPFYLFVAARLLRGARADTTGLVLMSMGLLGFVVPYFSTVVRHAHIYFFAMVATFVAACMLAVRSGGNQQRMPVAGNWD